jgi:predicted PurR-regulated permease PerM
VLERETGRVESRRVAERSYPTMGYYARVTLTIVGVLVLLAAAWAVRNILVLLLIAAILAVGLDPAVRRLERWKVRRGWAVALIFLAAIGFMVLFALLVIPPLVSEVQQLAADIPRYLQRLRTQGGFLGDLERDYQLSRRLQDLTQRLPSIASSSIGTILGITRSVASAIFNMLTIAILTIYFLVALPRGERTLVAVFTRKEQREADARTLDEALERIGGYVSGNLIVSLIAGITSFIFLQIVGVPFAAALAMWVAIADLIPTVGATLGAVVAVAVAFFSSVADGIATTIYFAAYQQVENYVIVPRVMKKAVDLSPAAVIVSVLIGGSLAGFAGALMALPLAAAAKVVIRDVWLKERLLDVPTDSPSKSKAKSQTT